MIKMERLKARREAERRRKRAIIEALKILPFVLLGYSLLWLLLAI